MGQRRIRYQGLCNGIFQAVEELLSEGFVPPTDVYLASSCTEEWGGDVHRR